MTFPSINFSELAERFIALLNGESVLNETRQQENIGQPHGRL